MTEKAFAAQDEYSEGWFECAGDLAYGISLGSDHAVMQQIKFWTDPLYGDVMVENQGDFGYATRMKEINKLIEEML
ncbi:MAG: hypothetical protein EOO06_00885 [Chitinophagaceae bacterium]|nr:MAG: hypothetical protein EOO06_00885 [Chitinophagaceae bacterium]